MTSWILPLKNWFAPEVQTVGKGQITRTTGILGLPVGPNEHGKLGSISKEYALGFGCSLSSRNTPTVGAVVKFVAGEIDPHCNQMHRQR